MGFNFRIGCKPIRVRPRAVHAHIIALRLCLIRPAPWTFRISWNRLTYLARYGGLHVKKCLVQNPSSVCGWLGVGLLSDHCYRTDSNSANELIWTAEEANVCIHVSFARCGYYSAVGDRIESQRSAGFLTRARVILFSVECPLTFDLKCHVVSWSERVVVVTCGAQNFTWQWRFFLQWHVFLQWALHTGRKTPHMQA